MPYIIGLVISLLLFACTYLGKHLTLTGAILAAIITALFSFLKLWNMLALLIIIYITLMIIDKVTSMKRKQINSDVISRSGARSVKQILANGFAPLLSTVFFVYSGNRAFLIVFAVGVGTTLADSAASDVGVLSKKMPKDICTWKPLTHGLSGGVSSLGSFVCISASLFVGLVAHICFHLSMNEALIVVGFSFIGSIIDSLLGSRIQAKFKCCVCQIITEKVTHCDIQTKHIYGIKLIGNCAINLISSIAVCVLSLACLIGGR